ncbi:hypothetical protein Leryth_010786 [Lithospermum erythrorhizon]|uniref:Protein kinase domain-containing protein n=1 Tax=Lithospermum erythrorhizon TaxID=34254 RepID=A0AAV3NWU5_LITER|nr:hypothetical protein Leryth_010786 [Lithospermum erythrorhizon]
MTYISNMSNQVRGVIKMVFLLILFLNIIFVDCFERVVRESYSVEPPLPSRSHELKHIISRILLSILFGVLTGLLCSLIFVWFVRRFVRYINRTPILKGPVVFSPKISPKTLQTALANEPEVLGSSPNGKYYKTVLDNGLNIAVKRLEPFENESPQMQSRAVKRRIQQDLEMLARLRHRHLMSLRAYIRESDRFNLVYDYMPCGSLEDVMREVWGNQRELSWEVRLRIAVGIVKGLQYLHLSCSPRILHYNLKPTNVMLDDDYEPRLADCGLAKIMNKFGSEGSEYSAPEAFQNCRYTDKSDIFSFGVILSMLLTSRDPADPFFEEASNGGSLVQWLRQMQQSGESRQALDSSILGEEMEEDEMLMAVRIAVVCVSDQPADRPSSGELVSMLTQLNSF